MLQTYQATCWRNPSKIDGKLLSECLHKEQSRVGILATMMQQVSQSCAMPQVDAAVIRAADQELNLP